jgi:hypothetical protein
MAQRLLFPTVATRFFTPSELATENDCGIDPIHTAALRLAQRGWASPIRGADELEAAEALGSLRDSPPRTPERDEQKVQDAPARVLSPPPPQVRALDTSFAEHSNLRLKFWSAPVRPERQKKVTFFIDAGYEADRRRRVNTGRPYHVKRSRPIAARDVSRRELVDSAKKKRAEAAAAVARAQKIAKEAASYFECQHPCVCIPRSLDSF